MGTSEDTILGACRVGIQAYTLAAPHCNVAYVKYQTYRCNLY